MFLFSSQLLLAQQTITKKEAKQLATEINETISQLSVSLQDVDWNQLSKLLNQSLEVLDQQTESLNLIVQELDTEKLINDVARIVEKIDSSIDTKQVEQKVEELTKKIEQAVKDAEVKKANQE